MVDKESQTVNYNKLKRTVRTGVRMMDNVVDATPYFLKANKDQALGERRLGMGVMGLHDLLIYCKKVYGSNEGNMLVDEVFKVIATEAYRESIELAKEKGSFPFMGSEDVRKKFINSGYMWTLPPDIREGVLRFGIRNSHILTVAPTGSTGTMTGVSTGLEPYFAFKYFRSGRLGKFIEVTAGIIREMDADLNNLPDYFVSSMELSPEAHADVQCIIQRWVDSSISKTVNAPKGYTPKQVQSVYERLYSKGAKGGTVYVDGSRDSQVLSLADDAADEVVDEPVKQKTDLGAEIGNTCPVCRDGIVIEQGGCNTCNTCGTQLKCGM